MRHMPRDAIPRLALVARISGYA